MLGDKPEVQTKQVLSISEMHDMSRVYRVVGKRHNLSNEQRFCGQKCLVKASALQFPNTMASGCH